MLGKLFKHEFIATGRILSILFGVLIIISPTTALYLKFRTSSLLPKDNIFFDLLTILCISAFTIAMIAAGITTIIVLLSRFYQSMVTRESYLTHTLPVTTPQLIISKLTVAVIWQIISIIMMSLSLRIFVGILGGWHDFSTAFRELIDIFAQMGANGSNVILLLLASLISIIVSYLKCYASFALGHMVNGHPFIGFIVSFIAISTITQIVSSMGIFILNLIFSNFINVNFDNMESISGWLNLALVFGILVNVVWGTLYYVITNYMFSRKLNI
ncbi:MAG: hypothetical protein HFH14_04345 [Lachnospiraceae bacterium]|nr:hypothetical protein [Lachnospiraceae bacterium]